MGAKTGSTIRVICIQSKKKPRINTATIIAANTLHGPMLNASTPRTIRSWPPSRANTYENAVAPRKIPNNIAPVRAECSVTSFTDLKLKLPLKYAKTIAPNAPMPDASVGVA